MISHTEAQELHRIIGQMHLQVTNKAGTDITEDETERALELAALIVADTTGVGADPGPSPVSYDPCIQGAIEIGGVRSEFLLPLANDSVKYSQWGADNTVLWPRVDLLEAMAGAANEWVADNLCRTCRENIVPDGGDGYDGMCPDCADKSTCAADCSPDDDEMMTRAETTGPKGVCTECGTNWTGWNGEDYDEYRYTQRIERETTHE